MKLRTISVLLPLLLLGIYTIKVPVLFMAGLLLLLGKWVFTVLRASSLDRIGCWVLVNYGYWLASATLVGAVSLADLANPSFYSGDARIFLNYLPLLFFSLFTGDGRDIRMIRRLLVWLGGFSIVLYVLWAAFRPDLISGGAGNNLFGFSTSHHGSGAFYSIIFIYLLIHGVEVRNRLYLLGAALVVLPIFGSASRSSMVGLIFVLFWYFLGRQLQLRQAVKFLAGAVVALALMIGIMPYVAPHTYERTAKVFSEDTLSDVVNVLKRANVDSLKLAETEGAAENILDRFALWVYATGRFIDSPIFGIGYGRFNDTALAYSGEEGVFYFATGGNKVFSVASAHNTYFHMLAESGLVGLGLLLWVWYLLYARLQRGEQMFAGLPEIRAFFLICRALVIFVLGASLFGHWCAAPASGIPVLTIAGVGMSMLRRQVASERLPVCRAMVAAEVQFRHG